MVYFKSPVLVGLLKVSCKRAPCVTANLHYLLHTMLFYIMCVLMFNVQTQEVITDQPGSEKNLNIRIQYSQQGSSVLAVGAQTRLSW